MKFFFFFKKEFQAESLQEFVENLNYSDDLTEKYFTKH